MGSYERTLCGRCIRKINASFAYKVTEIGPRKKCTCEECGTRAYGAVCRIDQETDANTCVMCGAVIPEGRQVCISCEVNTQENRRNDT